MPKSFSTFEMLNRLKYKESNIFVDVWFIENLQQEKKGRVQHQAGGMESSREGRGSPCSDVRYLSRGPSGCEPSIYNCVLLLMKVVLNGIF